MYRIADLGSQPTVNYAGTKRLCALLEADNLGELRKELEVRGIDPVNDVYDEIEGEFLTLAQSKKRYSKMAARAMENRYRVAISTREWAEAKVLQVDSGPKTVRIVFGGQYQVVRGDLLTFASLWDAEIGIAKIASGRQYGAWGVVSEFGDCLYGDVPDREDVEKWNRG